jgi:hypothetical protein
MIDVETINAASTITLLEAIEALYPMLALIHVLLDNARYHHAERVDWLARPECRIKLHFNPSYCPHLKSGCGASCTETSPHNKTYETCAQFADAALNFLREKVPRNWAEFCDSVTDNFCVINQGIFGW